MKGSAATPTPLAIGSEFARSNQAFGVFDRFNVGAHDALNPSIQVGNERFSIERGWPGGYGETYGLGRQTGSLDIVGPKWAVFAVNLYEVESGYRQKFDYLR